MATIGLLHGHDRSRKGTLNRQTIQRCKKAVELYKKGAIGKIAITIRSRNPLANLAWEMRHFLITSGIPESDIIVRAEGDDTVGEVLACMLCVSERDGVVSISSWYHIPRVWFIWKMICGRRVNLAPSRGGDWLDVSLEILAFPVSFLRFRKKSRSQAHPAPR